MKIGAAVCYGTITRTTVAFNQAGQANKSSMIEELVSRTNLNRAFKQVVKNGGSAGIDQMKVTELGVYLKENADVMREEIREKSYQASPILGVEIPKPNGKKRLLGIPTVVDRVFQQAMHQVLEPLFEPEFQQHSYGLFTN